MKLKYSFAEDEGQLIVYGLACNGVNARIAPYKVKIEKVHLLKQSVDILVYANKPGKQAAKKAQISILNLANGMKIGQFYITNPEVYKTQIYQKLKPTKTYVDNYSFFD